MTIYNWSQLSVEDITNYYLYGSFNKPTNFVSDSLIRPQQNTTINLDEVSFMATGPGRFVKAAMSPLVKNFFDNPIFTPTPGLYQEFSISQVIGMLGYADAKQYNISFHQFEYEAGSADFLQRSYIYDAVGFTITDTHLPANLKTKFIIEANGYKHIENIQILALDDDFDFIASSRVSQFANEILQPNIDPSKIGRTIKFVFDNASKSQVPITFNYDSTNYQDEKDTIAGYTDLVYGIKELVYLKGSLIKDLWDSGVIKFLDSQDRPILYGTDNNDVLSADSLKQYPLLYPYAKNGVVLIGGKGDDVLISGKYSDNLLGGDGYNIVSYETSNSGVKVDLSLTTAQSGGNAKGDILSNIENVIGSSYADTLTGNNGDNVIKGGGGDDIIYYSGGNDTIDGGLGNDTISYANTIAVTVDLNAGFVYGDTLSNIENVTGSSFNDTITGNSGDNIITGGGGSDTLTGGLGNDTFALNAGDGMDFITDAENGDKIVFNDFFGSNIVMGAATSIGNGLFQLGQYDLLQNGNDLYIDSKSGASVVIEKFFKPNVDANGQPVATPGFDLLGNYDGTVSYSFMGITIPATATNEKSAVNQAVQAIPGDNVRWCPIVLDLNVAANDNHIDSFVARVKIA